jgi:hypothetical protein
MSKFILRTKLKVVKKLRKKWQLKIVEELWSKKDPAT